MVRWQKLGKVILTLMEWQAKVRQGDSHLNGMTGNISMGPFERWVTKTELGFVVLNQILKTENPACQHAWMLLVIRRNVLCCEQSPWAQRDYHDFTGVNSFRLKHECLFCLGKIGLYQCLYIYCLIFWKGREFCNYIHCRQLNCSTIKTVD